MNYELHVKYVAPSGERYNTKRKLASTKPEKRFSTALKYIRQLESLGFIVISYKVVKV